MYSSTGLNIFKTYSNDSRQRQAEGEILKTWGTSKDKISCNTCIICLEKNEYPVECTCRLSKKKCICKDCRNVDKIHHYELVQSFQYSPILFDTIKQYGFCPMHKRIRCMENLAKMSEAKYARQYFGEKYCNSKTKNAALLDARKVFQKEFREKLGIKYYVPDPKESLKNM